MIKHNVTPQFILQKYAAGEENGRLQAATLFVDISGFTAVTEALMQHGKVGAETLADVMQTIFTPLIVAVYERGGFVAGFAGDAFTAIFPGSGKRAKARAVDAAWKMGQILAAFTNQDTPFGTFLFTGRVGVAAGSLNWGILGDGERRAFYFRGRAIDQCALAEHQAKNGEVVLATNVVAALAEFLNTSATSTHTIKERMRFLRLDTVTGQLPLGHPALFKGGAITETSARNDAEAAAAFRAKSLLNMSVKGEFRQVVTVFINVRGNPKRRMLAQFMQHCFKLLTQYDGYLCRIDFGDKGCNLLLFWGAPSSHENDIERALNFLLALQKNGALTLRAGVTYRQAFAGFAGSPLREEYTCYGLSINQAARQMMTAPWGALWLDAETAQRADLFDVSSIGSFPFKGFAKPQPLFQLTGHREAAAPFYRGLFAGRQAELAQLENRLDELRNGRFAGIVLISGEAGIGKSRLVDQFLRNQQENDWETQHFICPADEILRRPLNPFRYWLRRYFKQSATQDESTNKDAFFLKLSSLIAATADSALQAELERTHSFLGALVDLHWSNSLYEQLEPALRFENSLSALNTVLRAESLRCSLFLIIEDMQWLDEESRQFLQQLPRNMSPYPLAILLTSRQATDGLFDAELIDANMNITHISLTGLNEQTTIDIARGLLAGRPSPNLIKLLHARAEGNPFFLEQIVLYLQEEGLVEETAVGFAITTKNDLLPQDVQAVLVARLDRLTQEVRNVVQTAAVLGREFEVHVLSAMLQNKRKIQEHISEAEKAAIWSSLTELTYLFRHALLRDAAYQIQLQARLQQLHLLAATAIQHIYAADLSPYYVDLAFHYRRAKDASQEKQYARLAGEWLAEQYANEEAIHYLSRAIELSDANEGRYNLLVAREKVFDMAALRERQEQDLQGMLQIVQQMPLLKQELYVLQRFAGYYRQIGHYDKAKTIANKLRKKGSELNSIIDEVHGIYQYGWALNMQGHYKGAKPYLEEALTLLNQIDEPSVNATITQALANIFVNLGNYAMANQLANQAKSLNLQLGKLLSVAYSINVLGNIASRQSRFAEGKNYYYESLNIFRQIGAKEPESMVLNNIGLVHYHLSEEEQAEKLLLKALQIRQEIGDTSGEAMSLNNMGIISMDRGDVIGAMTYYKHCLAICANTGDVGNKTLALVNLGLLSIRVGDYTHAASYLIEAIPITREGGNRPAEAYALGSYAYLSYFIKSYDDVHHYANQALKIAKEMGDQKHELYVMLPLSHTYFVQGDFATAELYYREIRTHILEIDKKEEPIPLSGLIMVMQQQGKDVTIELNQLFDQINGKEPLLGTNEPMLPFWVCYRALLAQNDARAADMLVQAYKRLMEAAALISDEAYRTLFLKNIELHRHIVQAYSNQ